MIQDFKTSCNRYEKNKYTSKYFFDTSCPKCIAIGRFHLHASYPRNLIYLEKSIVKETQKPILRIKCLSCKSTHAVLPFDVIPYKIINVGYFLKILLMIYVEELPVKEIVKCLNTSFQAIYSYNYEFKYFLVMITNFLRAKYKMKTTSPSIEEIVRYICSISKSEDFLKKYLEYNGRPFLMAKFKNNLSPPVYFGACKI
jgi:hypothetical protein